MTQMGRKNFVRTWRNAESRADIGMFLGTSVKSSVIKIDRSNLANIK